MYITNYKKPKLITPISSDSRYEEGDFNVVNGAMIFICIR